MRRAVMSSTPNRVADPLDVLAAWPADRAVMMLHSGRVHPRWARWSIMARPSAWLRCTIDQSSLDGELQGAFTPSHDPLVDLDAALRLTAQGLRGPRGESPLTDGLPLPFRGGWIGYVSYELGGVIEPRARARHSDHAAGSWPLIELAYCPAAMLFDHLENAWHIVGGTEQAARDEMNEILQRAESRATSQIVCREPSYSLGELRSSISREEYMRRIERALDYIAAGDIYQANIAQRFSCAFAGSARALALDALRRAQPWYGAYLEFESADGRGHAASSERAPPRAIISLSPELFLEVDPRTRRVTTRPIKGTRPASSPARELRESAKDAAELHMIVDLMRNDLGRVCEYGSVEVVEPRTVETHPTVHQGVAEITGRLIEGTSATALLRATFPGGSVTGAPKIRAMQIIDELERSPRGPYCGAIGSFSDCGRVSLSVAIRTMLLRADGAAMDGGAPPGAERLRGTIAYSAGGGIVADSLPGNEYDECLVKCRVLAELIESSREPACAARDLA
jgi:para-aminobenzoate synthetase component 1